MPSFWKRRADILLCPNIPTPLHGVAPRVILGGSWWKKTRVAAQQSTNFRCQACGVHKDKAKFRQWLEGHELYEVDYAHGRLTYIETVPLCHACHNFIHDGRLTHLLDKGEIHHSKFSYIMSHGNRVLEESGLSRPSKIERDSEIISKFRNGKCAVWEDWRMVLFGKEYPPIHRTIEDYQNYWGVRDDAFGED